MRYVFVALTALALAACQQTAGTLPSGVLGPIAAEARAANARDLGDTQLETFLARLDLKGAFGARADEITDQLRRTRSAVAAQRSTGAGSSGPRHASVVAAAPGLFSVPLFARTFADSLEPLTKRGSSTQLPAKPYESTDEGATARTTTSLRTTETFTGQGSVVTYAMSWTYRTTTIDKTSGETILDMIDDRTMVGTIDVCPNADGTVPASLDVKTVTAATKLANGAVQQVKSESTSANRFSGRVDESATLRAVTQDFTEKASWQTASGTGTYDTSLSASHSANGDAGFLGGLDTGSFRGTSNSSGDLAGVDVSKATAWTFNIDGWALDEAFQAASRLWRNGRCVVVTLSEYGAETPLEVGEQTKSQHDEAVDQSSETKITVGTKHRFAGALQQSVTASLSGDKKLEPGRIDAVPAAMTFTAPDEQGKKATATLRSTSKRGIGTLVVDFHTGEDALTLQISATTTVHHDTIAGPVDQTFDVTIGPLEFKALPGDLWQARGEWSSKTRSDSLLNGYRDTSEGSEHGTIEMDARRETRAGKKVWVIDLGSMSRPEGSGSETFHMALGGQTIRGVTLPTEGTATTDGGSVYLLLANADELVIPAAGGTVPVSGTRSTLGMTMTVRGTATGTTTK